MKIPEMIIDTCESVPERIKRLTGIEIYKCPFCKKGQITLTEIMPQIRSLDKSLLLASKN